MILGSAGYMSPEQARGKRVDRRADIWAFGVLLFEMLTGRRLFPGETVTDTLAAVLTAPLEWGRLPRETPLRVRELLRHCLERDARQRLRDIGDARLELERAKAGPEAGEPVPRRRARWPAVIAVLAAGVAGVAAGAGVVFGLLSGRGARTALTVVRSSITLPESAPFVLDSLGGPGLALSRDGRHLAYVSSPWRRGPLYVRRLDDLAVRAVPETEGAFNPFFSPDGAWIAFVTMDGLLQKVAVDGGRPIVLARWPSSAAWVLGSWSDDGRIVLDSAEGGLRVIPAAGGDPTWLTRPSGEVHADPQVLPRSDVVLFQSRVVSRLRVEAVTLDGKARRTVLENANHPRYLASGHLLFMRDGGLMIASFDPRRLEVTGPAVSVPLPIAVDHPNPADPVPQLAASEEGVLVYVPSPLAARRTSTLVWVDRRGSVQEAGTLPFPQPHFALSPDGRRLAVTGRDAGRVRLDLFDLERGAGMRLVDLDVEAPLSGAFSADGTRILYGRWDMERSELLSMPIEGGAPELVLTVPGQSLTPTSCSPDGRFVALTVFDRKTGADVWVADLQAPQEKRARPFLVTPGLEWGAVFSPDGRLVAYSADEGRTNVYVVRFPGGDGKVRVSPEEGTGPQWSPDGTELLYQSIDGKTLLSVPVRRGGGLSFGEPRVVLEGPYLTNWMSGPSRAISPDGRRFLMTRQPDLHPLRASELVVVQGWFEEVLRLAGGGR